jgi:hypothetical protein
MPDTPHLWYLETLPFVDVRGGRRLMPSRDQIPDRFAEHTNLRPTRMIEMQSILMKSTAHGVLARRES